MTGRLVDMAFTLGGKQRVTLEINGDFREIWDKLHQEQVLDVEIKKHRESFLKCIWINHIRHEAFITRHGRVYHGSHESWLAHHLRV